MEFFYFIFGSFWNFVGFLLSLSLILGTLQKILIRRYEHKEIMEYGYPPQKEDNEVLDNNTDLK